MMEKLIVFGLRSIRTRALWLHQVNRFVFRDTS